MHVECRLQLFFHKYSSLLKFINTVNSTLLKFNHKTYKVYQMQELYVILAVHVKMCGQIFKFRADKWTERQTKKKFVPYISIKKSSHNIMNFEVSQEMSLKKIYSENEDNGTLVKIKVYRSASASFSILGLSSVR